MEFTGKNYIGKQASAESDQSFRATNPDTNETLPVEFYEATAEEVARAASLARTAFPLYQAKSPNERASFLEAVADEILALGDALIERCMQETALPEGRLKGERGRTMNQLRLFAQVVREGWWVDARIDTADPDRQPLPKPDIRQVHIPLGPVGIFGASNFPLAFSVAGGDTASALAAGCPIVVKAHPLHPGTSEAVGKAILAAAEKTGMPDGVFSLVQGPSPEVGMAMVNDPHICAIGFTGSFRGGKAIFDAANRRETPIPVFAEMGSSNPVFILPGALQGNRDKLAQGLNNSLNLGVGQFCTNPGMLVLDESDDTENFLRAFSQELGESQAGVMLSAGIHQGYVTGTETLAKTKGVELLATGQAAGSGNRAQSHAFSTNAATFLKDPSLQGEVFGPSTLAVKARGKKEMLELAASLEGHLTATILGDPSELEDYADLIAVLQGKVGRLIFNGFPTGVEVCHAMVHGGPFPATTAPQSTSVGTAAIRRFARPVCFQDFPDAALPPALKNNNPLGLWRLVNGEWTR